ncbi:hypothetical protein BJY00DRAFT_274100 [Aspergillus carlsbadensis]|nr:hypothetical protein BJY00DRAFT_274100 [Aspergillus carlsbadensis]
MYSSRAIALQVFYTAVNETVLAATDAGFGDYGSSSSDSESVVAMQGSREDIGRAESSQLSPAVSLDSTPDSSQQQPQPQPQQNRPRTRDRIRRLFRGRESWLSP